MSKKTEIWNISSLAYIAFDWQIRNFRNINLPKLHRQKKKILQHCHMTIWKWKILISQFLFTYIYLYRSNWMFTEHQRCSNLLSTFHDSYLNSFLSTFFLSLCEIYIIIMYLYISAVEISCNGCRFLHDNCISSVAAEYSVTLHASFIILTANVW